MKSYVKEFTYANKKGEVKNRKVLVLNENGIYLQGLELSIMTDDLAKTCMSDFANHDITDTIKKSHGKNPDRVKGPYDDAMRLFLKSSIVD